MYTKDRNHTGIRKKKKKKKKKKRKLEEEEMTPTSSSREGISVNARKIQKNDETRSSDSRKKKVAKIKQKKIDQTHAIEGIFGTTKKMSKEEFVAKEKKRKQDKKEAAKAKQKKKAKRGGNKAVAHRFDVKTGLPIYTMEALGMGISGGTPDCPFDCSCCF